MRSEDGFDFDGANELHDLVVFELGGARRAPSGQLPFALLRRELRWFYVQMHACVPVVGEAPEREVAAASRIAGWLSEVLPVHRGAFVLRYDGRRWPVRLTRQFGGLTGVVVRFAAMRRRRGPTETLAEAEQAGVAELLADVAATKHAVDFTRRGELAMDSATKLRRLQRAAQHYVLQAEGAYCDARGGAPCAVPSSREGA